MSSFQANEKHACACIWRYWVKENFKKVQTVTGQILHLLPIKVCPDDLYECIIILFAQGEVGF